MSDPHVRIPDPSLNSTLNYAKHFVEKTICLNFGATVATSSKYLAGAGNLSGDGYPIPYDGKMIAFAAFDTVNTRLNTAPAGNVTFNAGDTISMYANWVGAVFTISVYKNGAILGTSFLTPLGGVTDIFGTVILQINIPYV